PRNAADVAAPLRFSNPDANSPCATGRDWVLDGAGVREWRGLRRHVRSLLGVHALACLFGVHPSGCLFGIHASECPPDNLKGWTPNARFLDSQNRIIPSFPVIQNGILAPRLFSKLPSHFGEVFLIAGERPVLPPLHVAVVHRIIVDVIHRRPEMRVVAHITLRRAVLSEVVPVLEASSGSVVGRLLAG